MLDCLSRRLVSALHRRWGPVEGDPDTASLSKEQKEEREKSERLRLTNKFPKHVIEALDSF